MRSKWRKCSILRPTEDRGRSVWGDTLDTEVFIIERHLIHNLIAGQWTLTSISFVTPIFIPFRDLVNYPLRIHGFVAFLAAAGRAVSF